MQPSSRCQLVCATVVLSFQVNVREKETCQYIGSIIYIFFFGEGGGGGGGGEKKKKIVSKKKKKKRQQH